MVSVNNWNAAVYDHKLDFVSNYGKGVVELLQPKVGEAILDFGCGTGDLSQEIAKSGASVTGLDASEQMIQRACSKYPDIPFIVGKGETFRTEKKYDAVFSNAALHWMKEAEEVVTSIEQALRPGGRFVAEFGGKGNVETIVRGVTEVLAESYGIDATKRNPWYFPSLGTYSTLLEKHGFEVRYAILFARPTVLADEEVNIVQWLESFGDDFVPDFSEAEKQHIFSKVSERIKPALFKDGNWVLDYKRLRIVAVKKG